MRAIVFDRPGEESVLHLAEVERPTLGPNDLRIRVRATAVNRADLLQRQGFYPPPPGASPILGLECAGEVVEVGSAVVGWRPGERAMALLSGGGYAEEAVMDAGSAMHVPDALSWTEAGATPEVFLTAHLNVFMLGHPPAGGSVLVHGGGSGVGTAAITLCKQSRLRIAVTAGSDDKCELCRRHGADLAINYRTEDFAQRVRDWSGGAGVNVVLDCVGGRYLDSNLKALAADGRLVVIGLIGGASGQLDLASLLIKRLHVVGSTLRARPVEEKAAIVRSFLERFGSDLREGRIRPVIGAVFPLEEAAEAHRLVQSSAHFGKVALEVG